MKAPLPGIDASLTLADRIVSRLREAIQDGYFEPGEKLDQDRIAADFGVSRAPVREAVQKLAADGFVEIRPHRGAFVVTVTPEDVRNVFGMRVLLEPEVVRQVTPHIPDTVLDALQRDLDATRRQVQAGDSSHFFPNDIQFHTTMLQFAENKLLIEVLDGLTNRITMVRRYASLRPGPHMQLSLTEHQNILDAVRSRDPDQAAACMRQHIENSIARVLEIV